MRTPARLASGSRPRALVVAYCFPPHAAVGTLRTLRLVRRLVQEGWEVTILTASPRAYLDGTPVDDALLDRVPRGVTVIATGAIRPLAHAARLVAPFRRRRRGAPAEGLPPAATPARPKDPPYAKVLFDQVTALPDDEVGWLVPAVCRGLRAAWRQRPDVIYSSAPPWTGQIVAWTLASILGCRWVADFRDPWARGPWREGRLPVVRRAVARLESLVVSRADVVLFTTHAARDEVAAFYGPAVASRLRVVRNGCDAAEFAGAGRRPAADTFVLLHTGSLYGARNPLPLMRALARAIGAGAIDRTRFRLRLIGSMALAGIDLSGAVRELDLGGVVEIVPRVSRRESIEAIASASALLLIQPGHPLSVPAKTFEYLAAGRPLLAMTEENETAEIVRAGGNGTVVAPGDETALCAALIELTRAAHLPVTPVPAHLFDGDARAAEMAAVLRHVLGSATPSDAHAEACALQQPVHAHADAPAVQRHPVPAGEAVHE